MPAEHEGIHLEETPLSELWRVATAGGLHDLKTLTLTLALHARRRGLPYLSLMVTEDNVPARELYTAAGFTTERRMMTKTL